MQSLADIFVLSLMVFLSSCAFESSIGSEVRDIAVTKVTAWPPLALPLTIDINVTVENKGTSYETFNLTVHADNLTIRSVTIADLAPRTNKTLTFVWELFPFRIMIFSPQSWRVDRPMVENVTIWAEASAVAGEVDISDNVYIDGIVRIIWYVLDIDGDGTISIRDVALVAKAFGSSLGDPAWNPWVDFNQDGKINILDICPLARSFGKTYGLAEGEGK